MAHVAGSPAAHRWYRGLDRSFPQAGLLPRDAWARSQALSQLAWMNSTPHTTATRFFFPERYAESEAARAEVKKRATEDFRGYLERIQNTLDRKSFWFRDAYLFTLLRWGGYAGIDPDSFPAYRAYIERVMQAPPAAAARARERIARGTSKKAA